MELEKIKSFVNDLLDDVDLLRKSDMEVKERLPIEIMALNAVSNAYEKVLSK